MKKVVSLVLALMMVMAAVSALGENASAIDFDEAPYEIVVCYPVLSEAQPDLAMIEAALNEITLREINATVKLEAVGLFSMANIYALKASSQEKMDLINLMPGYQYLSSFAISNLIQPIDDVLAQWGPDVQALLGDSLNAGKFNGVQYAIPQKSALTKNALGFKISVPLSEKYGIDVNAIETLEDLEAAFEIIRDNEPGITVVVPEQTGSTISMVFQGYTDGLGTTVARLTVAEDGSLKAICSLDTDIYMEASMRARDWYERGFISRDVNTAQESGSQMMRAGKVYATASPSVTPEMGSSDLVDNIYVSFDLPPIVNTSDSQLQLWAIPTSCQRPDKAMQLLNLMDSNEEITRLLRFGIEGVHYNLLADGSADTSTNGTWSNYWDTFGNSEFYYVRADQLAAAGGDMTPEEFNVMNSEWNATVEYSPAYGFTFDPSAVRTEISACDAVNSEFQQAIGNGTVDPITEMPKYRARLEAAGMQIIIDEVQRQLDEWAAIQ